MDEHSSDDRELGPTYKNLFFGACLIIGGAFGWWFTNFVSALDYAHRDYERRIAELEAGIRQETWERESLRRDFVEIRRRVEK